MFSKSNNVHSVFISHGKGKNARKNKTVTDPDPTTNPDPKLTIDKAAKRKELNKVHEYRHEVTAFQWLKILGKSSESVQCAMLKACDACADISQL